MTWARLFPALVTTTEPAVVAVISVMPKNSDTTPVTWTRWPSTTGVGHPPQNTKMPSEVCGSASTSASSSWRKKPASCVAAWNRPITTPSTTAVLPGIGVALPLPCTSWMRTTDGGAVTFTVTAQLAVWGTASLLAHWMVTPKLPRGVVFETPSVALAVPPTPPAGVNPVRVMVPGLEGVMLVMVALVTVPSASVALMGPDVAVPCVVLSVAGQVGTTGALPPDPWGVIEKSSMPRPWSAPVWSGSDQRSITSVPFGMLSPVMEKVRWTRLAARLPSSGPGVPPVMGLVKSRLATATPADWNSARVPVTVGEPKR